MADGEQRHIDADMLHTVEEEDHPEQEQDVVIAGDHVLGPQIDIGQQVNAGDFADIAGVAGGHAMGLGCARRRQKDKQGQRRHEPLRPHSAV